MIPLKDENPTKAFPFVTVTLISLNALVFIYELALGSELKDAIMRFAVVPYEITHLNNPSVVLTLITSLFFHVGFAHILGNMLYLWVFGNNIEDKLGPIKFVFFYFICGIVASLGHIMMAPASKVPMIGASGAVSGVLGAYILLYPRAKVMVLIPIFFILRIVKIEALWFLLFWIILQFFYGATSLALAEASGKGGVAWFAHVAGFFTGMLFLKLFLSKREA